MSCSGNCGSCKSKPKKINIYGSYIKTDISAFLRPEPKPIADDTPLYSKCTCPDGLNVRRSACLPCIRSWVQAIHCFCKIEEEIEKYTEVSPITAERIRTCVEEKKNRDRFGKNEHKCNCEKSK